jgi:hypothetical protein
LSGSQGRFVFHELNIARFGAEVKGVSVSLITDLGPSQPAPVGG